MLAVSWLSWLSLGTFLGAILKRRTTPRTCRRNLSLQEKIDQILTKQGVTPGPAIFLQAVRETMNDQLVVDAFLSHLTEFVNIVRTHPDDNSAGSLIASG